MEYLKTLFVGILNIFVLLYIMAGICWLMLLTIALILFSWSETISDGIRDMYADLSKALKDLF